jgi:hypothetical protein
MNDVGPLYYDSHHEGGYYYYDDNEMFYYVFSSEYFTVEREAAQEVTPGTTNGATDGATDETTNEATGQETTDGVVVVGTTTEATNEAPAYEAIDPNTEPLPPDAVCSALSMKVSDYVVGMDGNLNVDDFMVGIGVAKYSVDRNDQDDKYHLTYSVDGQKYDMTLKNKTVITPGRELLIYKK